MPAVLVLVLVMFSLESRPSALSQGLAADVVFEGAAATTTANRVSNVARDRRAGTPGDRRAAGLVAAALRERGFDTEVDRFRSHERDLVNVVGRRAGQTRRQIVVVADRDATGVPDTAGSASDTAALIQLARVFQGRPSAKTLVLASVDGSALGQVGTARLASSLGDPALVDGVIAMSDLGYGGSEAPSVISWSNDTGRAGLRLQRTATASVRNETGRVAPSARSTGQIARLSFPIGIGAQGVLIDSGYDAVRIAGGGELQDTSGSAADAIDPDRLGALGRAVLRTVTALDQGRGREKGPNTYVTAVSQVMPGWVLSVLGIALILPALVASVDAFARVRRRRAVVLAWVVWLGTGVLALVIALGFAHFLSLLGAIDAPSAPVAPDLYPIGAGSIGALVGLAIVVGLAWFGLRRLAVATDPDLRDPAAPGAAVVVSLALVAGTLGLWLVNPLSALIMVPALHLWMLAALIEPAPSRRARLVLVFGGLALPFLLVVYDMATLSVNPLGGVWYLVLLVTGGHVSFVSALLGCLFVALLQSIVAIALSKPPDAPPPERILPTVRGPAGYAGPGSLGGTDSAMRR